MVAITSALTAISAAAVATSKFNKIIEFGGKVLKGTQSVSDTYTRIGGQHSLTDVAKLTRAQFFTVVDNDCLNADFMPDVAQSALNIAIGYYLQAIAVLGSVDSAKVGRTLARVTPTPHNSQHLGGGSSWNYSGESYSIHKKDYVDGSFKLAAESYKWKLPLNTDAVSLEKDGIKDVALMNSGSNLSIGKMVEITLSDSNTDAKSKVTLPISFRLNAIAAPSTDVVTALSLDNLNTTFSERYFSYKMEDISFWKDLVLCQDLIKERKKLMLSNKNGVIQKMIERSNSGSLSGLLNKKPSLGSATAIFIISSTTAEELEKRLASKLNNVATRNRIFQSGSMMLLIIVDKAYERVTIYHRDIAEPTELSLRDMKMANKDSGPNLTDIMKAFMMGNSPSF